MTYFHSHILPPIEFTYRIFLPLVLILVSNIMIIIRLFEAKHRINVFDYKITLTLLAISGLYLITQIPTCAFLVYRQYVEHLDKRANYKLFMISAHCFAAVNNALNGLIYGLTSKLFREESHKVFCFFKYSVEPKPSTRKWEWRVPNTGLSEDRGLR